MVRYIPFSRLRKTEDDVIVGVLGAAFRLRNEETYLSATWLEYFKQPTREANIESAVKAVRASKIDVRPKSGFAIGNVGEVKEICLRNSRRRIRIIHEPEDDNKAHTALRGWPSDDNDLLELIAEDIWSEVILNVDVPA